VDKILMKHQTTLLLFFLVTVLFHSPATALEGSHFPVNEDLQAWMTLVSRPDEHQSMTASEDPRSMVARFYQLVGYRTVWNSPDGLLPEGEILLQTIKNASAEGLSFDDYLIPDHETALVDTHHGAGDFLSTAVAPYVQMDVILTQRILRYARHLSQGRILPEKIYQTWLAQRRPMTRDLPAELAQALENDRLPSYIESLHPQSGAYQGLRKALRQYEDIRRSGGWPPIASGPTLAKGDEGPRIAMLNRRLNITGDGFNGEPIGSDVFDDSVVLAVKHFQHRHGLREDGVVGKETLAELNIPVEKRLNQLMLNMERWRWFPDSFGDRYLMVNIPAFALTIVDKAKCIDRIRVIVGKQDRQTPIMSDRMTYIEFNPYWNIPQKIASKDILPKVIDDPSYLTRQGIRVFDSWEGQAQALDPASIAWDRLSDRNFPYRLRQDPSHVNALGQMKFMFPNRHSIYIHDTPGKSLFDRQARIFSSGCVRIEEPMTLAHYLLSEQGWNQRRLQAITAHEQRKSVVLTNPIAVHLVYFTAWVDEDEMVNFRKDIYGRDARMLQALHHPAPDLIVRGNPAENKNLLAIVKHALNDRQNGMPPDEEHRREKKTPKPAIRFDSAFGQTGSGYGNGTHLVDG
jgi:L,D-transpeptidase YcbB